MTNRQDMLELAARMFAVLSDFPADGQLRNGDPETMTALKLSGFIQHRESRKPCPTCGTEKVDHSWFQITGGGRMFMAVMERASQPQSHTKGEE